MTILIDNYDSFTFNVYQCLLSAGAKNVRVLRNDEVQIDELIALKPQQLLIGPGPGRPEQAGISLKAVEHFAGKIPIMGISLGHLVIAEAFGGKTQAARNIKHGLAEEINLDGKGLFRHLPSKMNFVRYHSLAIEDESLPECFEISAQSGDGEIMGIRHRNYPIEGLQFHPESIASLGGMDVFKAFLAYRLEPFAYKATLEKLIAGEDLSRNEAEAFMEELTEGALDETRTATLLTALAAKGPCADEIAGCAAVLRRKKTPFKSLVDTTDTCGTGGDDQGSFNISSMAALVAAACGLPMAKHGNRAVSSKTGSAEFYRELGIPVDISPHEGEELLRRYNFVFLFAPTYHGAMRFAAAARATMGVKTIMNLIGPLSNPADSKYQIIGVYDRRLREPVARAARQLGVERVLVLTSRDGFDEISPSAPTDILEIGPDDVLHEYVFDPGVEGFGYYNVQELAGGDPVQNAALARDLVSGAGRPAIEAAVAFNAGAALYVAGRAQSIAEGAHMAAQAIANGEVAAKIEKLKGAKLVLGHSA